MKKNSIYRLTLSAVFASLIFVATAFINVPLPGNGYANLGDCFVVTAALMLGMCYGTAAAGIGAMLADIFLGFALYAPATLIIKALMAIVVCVIFKAFRKKGKKSKFIGSFVAAFFAELVMILGYFVYEIFLYGLPTATVDIVGNSLQGLVGFFTAPLLFSLICKTKIMNKIK